MPASDYIDNGLAVPLGFDFPALRSLGPVHPMRRYATLWIDLPFLRGGHFADLAVVLRLDDGTSHVVATISADTMRGHSLAAGRAKRQLAGREEVVRPPGTGLLIRLTSLGNGHGTT
jgi:hypothetical protein